MLDSYDKILKAHIQSFLEIGKKKIPVYGLQNDSQTQDEIFTQAGSGKDKISLPIIAMVRFPEILITDDAGTKKSANYEGYSIYETSTSKITLNCMRCNLSYAVDVYAENKKTAEDLGTQLYFRLRNNPNIDIPILLPIKDENKKQLATMCTPNIVMDQEMTHLRMQSVTDMQLYRFRLKFILQNVNLFDCSEKDIFSIKYNVVANTIQISSNDQEEPSAHGIVAKLSTETSYKNIL